MPRPSIEQLRAVGDFAEVYRWNLQFVKFPSAVAGAPTSNDLNIRCETVDLPKRTGTKVTTNIRGHQVHSPGIYNYGGELTIKFVETVDNKVHNFLRAWREACSATKTGVSNPKSTLEGIIRIERLNRQDVPIWEYKLTGCFLNDADYGGTLDGATSDHIKPSLIISYDFFEDRAL